ncbi:MAG: hypothetical protein B7Y12_01185 [Rhizobiales bacterium 24-66-13]|nr:MAG: hypothetical protein B7Z41_07575 [Rhizobiales bacterium 12-66-7]OYZ82983.1 MAG: hypothetical protein B7Y12_01185 [Rhizobiales bacterium 24-66-13]OZB12230.1 MAG: hypothetical protein B7X67_00150 [Rhizobiales bacterium 39-66-18]
MTWVKTILSELFGLFVDDGNFAVAILLWIGAVWFLSLNILDLVRWNGVVFFCGLALILIESTIRRARR